MGMNDDASPSLPLPGKDVLLDCARRAFTEADKAVTTIGSDQVHRIVPDRHGADRREAGIGDVVLNWLTHDNRHLGMVGCLLGVQGLRGTATR